MSTTSTTEMVKQPLLLSFFTITCTIHFYLTSFQKMSEADADPDLPPKQVLKHEVQDPPVDQDPTALIHDLANIVKDQQYFNAEPLRATHGQLQSLTQTVESFPQRFIDLPPKSSDGLCLPNIQLPEYTGQENLDCFHCNYTAFSRLLPFWPTIG